MADWTFTTANALTSQTWAKQWWIESKKASYFYGQGLVGADENQYPIVEFSDLNENQGYQHTYGQVRDLTGAGVTGDSTLEGNEEEPVTFDDQITINQVRNAIRTAGKLSERYPSDKRVRTWAESLLKRWMAAKIDQDIFDALGTSLTKVIYGGDATLTTDIEAGDYFTLALISKAVAYAGKATPQIVPVPFKGKEYFICVISDDQSYDLKIRDAAWQQANREGRQPGLDNPIFTGNEGVWDNTVIHKHRRVATATTWGTGTNLNGATALFLGLQAAGIAYAVKRVWNEKTFDYGNKAGFAIGAIYGVSKTVFNSADNGVVGIRTYRSNN
jgi:N4-gp56 family major capsid protein